MTIAIINNLTARTVPTLLTLRSPFLYLEHSNDNGVAKAEKSFENFKQKLSLIEEQI